MINGKDIYDVFSAITPLYVAMILAYGSVRWWHIFTPDQCSGINRFVAVFAVPLLSFHFISTNDIYNMNFHFILADSLQKIVILIALSIWHNVFSAKTKHNNLDWMITLFSLSTLPNTLVMGIPLLTAMYGEFSGGLMVQIVVMQSVIWYTLMLFMFEYRGAKALIAEQFPADIAGSITSFRVESDVMSLNGRDPLQADAEIGTDGKVHVTVRRSTASSLVSSYNKSGNGLNSLTSMTPRASNLTGVEIYSLQSSRDPTPRGSSFNQSDFYAMFQSKMTSPSPNPNPNAEEENTGVRFGKHRGAGSRSSDFMNGLHNATTSSSYPAPNPMVSGLANAGKKKDGVNVNYSNFNLNQNVNPNKDLHMFVWSSTSASPVSEANLRNAVNRAASVDFGAIDSNKATFTGVNVSSENASPIRKAAAMNNGEVEIEDGFKSPVGKNIPAVPMGSPFNMSNKKVAEMNENEGVVNINQQMPPTSVMTRLILIMVWRKLIRNPNTYSSLIGLIWSLISFRWNIEMPTIIKGSISILSDAGLGMAMFSLGLFMALQPKIIACGNYVAAFSMAVRFLTGPAVIAATSIAIGLRGVLLHVAIVQAALPQGIVPFVFAKEYNCHPDILSTAVIFGMLVALPITILYYVLLGV